MATFEQQDLLQFRLSEIICSINDLNLELEERELLAKLIINAFDELKKPDTRKADNVTIIFENIQNHSVTFSNQINFITEENGNWQLQFSKTKSYPESGIMTIDTEQTVYYELQGKLAADAIIKHTLEHCGEQKISRCSKTYVYEAGEWVPELVHEIVYFQDKATHEITVTNEKSGRPIVDNPISRKRR